MTYWQVAAGDRGRYYQELFFDHGILCVGRGFLEKVKELKKGDKVVLKEGKSKVLGAGIIEERNGIISGMDEEWLGDFDGWNLGTYACVEWHRPTEPIMVSGLNMGTIMKTNKSPVHLCADNIISAYPKLEPKPRPDLSGIRTVEDREIIEFLIRKDFKPVDAEKLMATFNRIRLLAGFYCKECYWDEVREHETRTFLIMPLLHALGWPEQQLKVELPSNGKKIDIAAFSQPYIGHYYRPGSKRPDCKMTIESKGFNHGLYRVEDQAEKYAAKFPECTRVIVSNGYCYKVFPKEGMVFPEKPSAYMNLLNPKNRHPLYPDSGGILEVFEALLP